METLTGKTSGAEREAASPDPVPQDAPVPQEITAPQESARGDRTVPRPRRPEFDEPWPGGAGGTTSGAPTFPAAHEKRFSSEERSSEQFSSPEDHFSDEQRPAANERSAPAASTDPGFPQYDTVAVGSEDVGPPAFDRDESWDRPPEVLGGSRQGTAFPAGPSPAEALTSSTPSPQHERSAFERAGFAEPGSEQSSSDRPGPEQPEHSGPEQPEHWSPDQSVSEASGSAVSPGQGRSLAEIRASLRKVQERRGVPPAFQDTRDQQDAFREGAARDRAGSDGFPERDLPEVDRPEADLPETDRPEADFPEPASEAPFPRRDLPEQDYPERNDPEQRGRRRARHAEPDEPLEPAQAAEGASGRRSAHERGEPASDFLARYERAVREDRPQRAAFVERGGQRDDAPRWEPAPDSEPLQQAGPLQQSGPAPELGSTSESASSSEPAPESAPAPETEAAPEPGSAPEGGPEQEPAVDAGLADLLAEALAAYETGKRDEPEAESAALESASHPDNGHPDLGRHDTSRQGTSSPDPNHHTSRHGARHDTGRAAGGGRPAAEYFAQSTSDGASVPTRHRRAAVDAASTSSPGWTPGR